MEDVSDKLVYWCLKSPEVPEFQPILHKLLLDKQWELGIWKWDFTPVEKQNLEEVMWVKHVCVWS